MCLLKKTTAGQPLPWHAHGAMEFTRLIETDARPATAPTGSARRKLWQFSPQAACPVIGVCLRLPDLQRLARKAGIDTAGMSEYELHTTVVSECKKRTPLAEAVQRELESRFALAVAGARKLKSTQELQAWCDHHAATADLAALLWVTLTHARCTSELEFALLGHVHMLQHQVGMAARVDHAQLDALVESNARLMADLQQARDRIATQLDEAAARQQAAAVREAGLRGEVTSLAAALARAREECEALRRAAPDLQERLTLSQANAQLQEELRVLRRALTRQREERLAVPPGAPCPLAGPARAEPCRQGAMLSAQAPCGELRQRTVLCVGGRAASVPVYREVVEHRGARFLHHDGGEQDSIDRLARGLSAADLVLCQTGCIGHNAYWRVKEHCKRHNIPCVFLKTPSRAALERVLETLGAHVAHEEGEADAG